jgi:hypothetical protein
MRDLVVPVALTPAEEAKRAESREQRAARAPHEEVQQRTASSPKRDEACSEMHFSSGFVASTEISGFDASTETTAPATLLLDTPPTYFPQP